jgi:hypothetical protein
MSLSRATTEHSRSEAVGRAKRSDLTLRTQHRHRCDQTAPFTHETGRDISMGVMARNDAARLNLPDGTEMESA